MIKISEDVVAQKDSIRAEAKRARGLMSLCLDDQKAILQHFFKVIPEQEDQVIAAYWTKGRELDTQLLIDECLERGLKVALPVIEKGNRVLRFARWDNNLDLEKGLFGVLQPTVNENTEWLEPDVFIIPLLAFDRRGYRLGYGGGFYDATLAHYKEKKDIIAIGIGYAQQACLFNLPIDAHDMKMDCIITEQSLQKF